MKTLIPSISAFIFYLFILFPAGAFAQEQKYGNLEITITGVTSPEGNILIGAGGDPKDPSSMNGTVVRAVKGTVTVTLRNLLPGENTIYIFHDLNGDYILERNEKGIPLEPCCILKTAVKAGENKAAAILELIEPEK